MPEADAVRMYQARLEERFLGHPVVVADSRWAGRISGLDATTLDAVNVHGKVMWMDFSDDTSLVVHLGMKGKWRFSDGRSKGKTPGADGFYLGFEDGSALLRFPKVFDRVPTAEVKQHRSLAHLGPDILGDTFDLDDVVKRARARDDDDLDIAELVLEQDVCAGIGNIFKCEALAALKLHPWAPANGMTTSRFEEVFTTSRAQMQQRLKGKLDAGYASQHPFSPQVYQRHKEGCRLCGGGVVVEEHGGDRSRLTWWCPHCQTLEQ